MFQPETTFHPASASRRTFPRKAFLLWRHTFSSLAMRVQSVHGGNSMLNPQEKLRQSTSVAIPERRSESRATIEFRIEVSGFDRFGRFYTEFTMTSDVSLMGCAFPLHMEVEKGLLVAVRVVHPRNEGNSRAAPVLFHIVRTSPCPDGYFVGVVSLLPGNPWINYSFKTDGKQPPAA